MSAGRVFFGETINLEVRLANRKLLPLPWIHVEDEVPEGFEFLKGKLLSSHKPERFILSNFLTLGWYRSISRRYPVKCVKRGYFTFGPARMRSGDLFGFFSTEASNEKVDYVMVYPRIVPLEKLGIPSRDPFGDLRLRRHLFEDPARVMTTRDYVPGDPMRRIHWKSTARLQRLQTKVFEPTTTVDLALFLDVRTAAPPFWGVSTQKLETLVIAATSIVNHAIQNSYRVGLYTNEPYRYTGRMIKLAPSDHPDQLLHVLEALAQVQGWPLLTLDELMEQEARSLPWNATLALVTATPDEAVLSSISHFQRAGRRIALVIVGEGSARLSIDGVPVYHVSDQVDWQDLQDVQLKEPSRI